ncbi:MAG: MMPL family transporter, partial [Mycobacterium sp.]
MSDEHMGNQHTTPPFVARTIHRFSVPIILAWLAIAVIVAISVPPLEQVEKEHSVTLSPDDAPSFKAMKRISADFKETNSDSVAMIVLEGQQPLGDDAHRFYNHLIRQLEHDPKHVQHIQNFWGDPLTAGAAQSPDGKATYVQLNLAGRPASTMANESVEAVRDIVARTPAPPGVK